MADKIEQRKPVSPVSYSLSLSPVEDSTSSLGTQDISPARSFSGDKTTGKRNKPDPLRTWGIPGIRAPLAMEITNSAYVRDEDK